MPRLTQSTAVRQTTTATVSLNTLQKRKLLTELRAYAALRDQSKVIALAMEKHKNRTAELFADAGVDLADSVELDGFKTKRVGGVQRTLDKKILIALGVTLEMLDEATTEKPKRPHVKISCPGEPDDDAHE